MKDIDNYENDILHGYQEWYERFNGMYSPMLVVRLTYHYGREIGYEEMHLGTKLCYYHII